MLIPVNVANLKDLHKLEIESELATYPNSIAELFEIHLPQFLLERPIQLYKGSLCLDRHWLTAHGAIPKAGLGYL